MLKTMSKKKPKYLEALPSLYEEFWNCKARFILVTIVWEITEQLEVTKQDNLTGW